MKYPTTIEKASDYLWKYTDDTGRIDTMAGRMLSLVERYGAIDEYGRENTTILIDEGFAFSAASVLHPPQPARPVTEDDLRAYISAVPVPDVIIFTRASPACCVTRIRERSSGPPPSWDPLDPSDYLELATEAEAVAETIAELFEAEGSRVVEVRTEDQSVGQSVSVVERALTESFRGAGIVRPSSSI